MGALSSIISAISTDVVAALADASYPPLTPDQSGNAGAILVGTAAAFEQTCPPRIIFEPKGSKFVAAEYASNSATLSTLERQNQSALRTIGGEDITFDVRCWGAAGTGNPVDDYDVTRALYHQVRASLQKLMPGSFEIEEAGKFTTGTNVVRDGREFVFSVTFFTPILDALLPYDIVNYSDAERATLVEELHAPADVVPSDGPIVFVGTDGGSESFPEDP